VSHIPWQSQAILNLLNEPKTIEEIYEGLSAFSKDSKYDTKDRLKKLYIKGLIYEIEGKYFKR
jgi:predicted transcriptional regulator